VQYGEYLSVGPEYETLFSLGSNCGVGEIDAIIAADRLCDEYGIDTISGGGVISMAMECAERGLLDKDALDGIDLSFGDHENMVKLVERIGNREGIGWVMGEGTVRFAEYLGGEAWKYAIQVKGLEVPAHSARGLPGMAIGYATSNRGGTHQDGRPTAERAGIVDPNVIEGKGTYEVEVQRMTTFMDNMIMCRMLEGIFGLTGLTEDHVRLVKVTTGMDLSLDELKDISDRVYTLERATNIREGETRRDDKLPWRFMEEPIPDGPSKGKYIPKEMLDKLLDETYEARGWDRDTGLPKQETLKRLGLQDVAREIYE
jgi:aldehyde:ferredoxin oxidoreductase